VGSDRRDNEKNTLARNKENHARNLPQAIDASTRRAFWMKRLKSGPSSLTEDAWHRVSRSQPMLAAFPGAGSSLAEFDRSFAQSD